MVALAFDGGSELEHAPRVDAWHTGAAVVCRSDRDACHLSRPFGESACLVEGDKVSSGQSLSRASPASDQNAEG